MIEQPKPKEKFNSKVIISQTYPYDKASVPMPDRAYLTPREGVKPYYFIAEEKGSPIGFIIVDVDKHNQLHFIFKWVSLAQRRRGVGQTLTNAFYEWAAQQGFKEVISGINDVFEISADGAVSENVHPSIHGGWPSYGGMTKAEGLAVRLKRDISFARIDKGGLVSLGFRTHLNAETNETMPATAEGLLELLYAQGVLPKDKTPQELFEMARMSTIVCVKGEVLSFLEWINSLN